MKSTRDMYTISNGMGGPTNPHPHKTKYRVNKTAHPTAIKSKNRMGKNRIFSEKKGKTHNSIEPKLQN